MATAVDRRFDVVWFGGPKAYPLHAEHFKRLLKKGQGGRGHFLVMPTTAHQDEIEKTGNLLAFYYQQMNKTRKEDPPTFPVVKAPEMLQRILDGHFHGPTGPFHTGWIFLNEISSKLWPTNPEYRKWVIAIAEGLQTRGLRPVVFSPFPSPPKNRADWKTLADHAHIAVENYVGGHAIVAQGKNAPAFCEQQYGATMTRYTGHGIAPERIFITEHFGHTKLVGTVRRGRCSITMNQWLNTIDTRTAALQKLGFGGFVSFAWMYNQMGAPLGDLLKATDRYLARRLP